VIVSVLCLLAALLAGCTTAAPPEPATAAPAAPADVLALRAGDRYVALGSSFAAGPGLTPVADEPCRRSAANYAAQVAAALRLQLTDVSCAATTTDNVLTKRHDTGDDERAPQIEAVGPDARLVTITIGGNDVGYATLLDDYACSDNGTCPGVTVDDRAVTEALGTVTDRLVTTLEAIRERAPQALVLLVTYPQIVPASGETCPAVALSPEHARTAAAVAAELQRSFITAAERTGVRIVDAYSAGAGHSACAAADPWIGGWIREEQYRGPRSFHPTAAGMRAQADLIVQALTATR
jgi:lysophospholipase L1-like esterase